MLAVLLRANRASFERRGYALTSARNLRWLVGVALTLLAVAGPGSALDGSSTLRSHLDQIAPHLHCARNARALLGMAVTFLAWLADKQMAELGFTLGSFRRDFLAWGPIAIVRQAGSLVAFASIAPDFGHRRECGIDLMRHLPDAPHGTMDFLFTQLILHAKEAGYTWFDLGMAPLSGVGRSPWSPRDERVLKLAYALGNRFYNYQGLRQYKEKFSPQWRGVYMAYPRGRPLPVVLMDVTALVTRGQRAKRAGR